MSRRMFQIVLGICGKSVAMMSLILPTFSSTLAIGVLDFNALANG